MRLMWGRIFIWLNFIILGIGVYFKWKFIKNFNDNKIPSQCDELEIYGYKMSPASFAEAVGCVFEIPCNNAGNEQPIIDNTYSFITEGLIGILYMAAISFIADQIILRDKLKKKQLNLLFAKVVKDKKDFFSDTEEEETVSVDVFAQRSDQSVLKKK